MLTPTNHTQTIPTQNMPTPQQPAQQLWNQKRVKQLAAGLLGGIVVVGAGLALSRLVGVDFFAKTSPNNPLTNATAQETPNPITPHIPSFNNEFDLPPQNNSLNALNLSANAQALANLTHPSLPNISFPEAEVNLSESYAVAEQLITQNKLDEAIKAYDKIVEQLIAKDKLDEAVTTYVKAAERMIGEYSKAEEQLIEKHKLNKEHLHRAIYYYHRGMAGNLGEGVLDKAIALEKSIIDKAIEVYSKAGTLLILNNRSAEGTALLDQAAGQLQALNKDDNAPQLYTNTANKLYFIKVCKPKKPTDPSMKTAQQPDPKTCKLDEAINVLQKCMDKLGYTRPCAQKMDLEAIKYNPNRY